MGHATYSNSSRSLRAESMGFASNSVTDNFKQSAVRRIHESMDPKTIKVRESRDSELHPNTVPIIINLDLTGSMGSIPQQLVIEGLPKMVAKIIQSGVPDPQILFVGVGDHEYDSYPLQVGQFESGDAELDTWLTRTYLEGGGGGNIGESYLLAWYLASNHTVSDSWEKRKQKGLLFTIGDEKCLPDLPMNALKGLMDNAVGQGSYTAADLLKKAQEQYLVYHIHIDHRDSKSEQEYWKNLLGQNCIITKDYTQVPKIIAETVLAHAPKTVAAYKVDEETMKITL